MTLRQEIEKIEHSKSCTRELCVMYQIPDQDYDITDCCKCRTDRICEAIGKTAENQLQAKNYYTYWQKELGK